MVEGIIHLEPLKIYSLVNKYRVDNPFLLISSQLAFIGRLYFLINLLKEFPPIHEHTYSPINFFMKPYLQEFSLLPRTTSLHSRGAG